jgi:hypothetical protein
MFVDSGHGGNLAAHLPDPGCGFAFEAAAVHGAGAAAGATTWVVAGAGHGTGAWRRQGDCRGGLSDAWGLADLRAPGWSGGGSA